jgi:hypothetical protein
MKDNNFSVPDSLTTNLVYNFFDISESDVPLPLWDQTSIPQDDVPLPFWEQTSIPQEDESMKFEKCMDVETFPHGSGQDMGSILYNGMHHPPIDDNIYFYKDMTILMHSISTAARFGNNECMDAILSAWFPSTRHTRENTIISVGVGKSIFVNHFTNRIFGQDSVKYSHEFQKKQMLLIWNKVVSTLIQGELSCFWIIFVKFNFAYVLLTERVRTQVLNHTT